MGSPKNFAPSHRGKGRFTDHISRGRDGHLKLAKFQGKIPKNEHGNLYLFAPWMVPEGCIYLRALSVTNGAMIRRAGIEAADAVVGNHFFS